MNMRILDRLLMALNFSVIGVLFVMALALAITGCTAQQTAVVDTLTAQATQDIQTLAGGLPAIETALQAAGTLTAAQASQVQGDVSKAVSAASALAAMPSIPTNATPLATFEVGVNDLLTIASTVAPTVPAIQAAEVIVPLIEVGANIVVPQVQSLVSAAPAPAALAPTMTPAEARLILRAAAGK